MDLTLSETQEMFKKVAADFVKAEVPAHQMTQWYRLKETFRPELYRKAAEVGCEQAGGDADAAWAGRPVGSRHAGRVADPGVVPGRRRQRILVTNTRNRTRA